MIFILSERAYAIFY